MVNDNRLNGLDAVKAIAAFLVVCIHMPFPNDIGYAVMAIAKSAVPFFFMVSGYFFLDSNNSISFLRLKTKIIHLLPMICLTWGGM